VIVGSVKVPRIEMTSARETLIRQKTFSVCQWKRHVGGIRLGNRDPDLLCGFG
jgi:hypothetical protein